MWVDDVRRMNKFLHAAVPDVAGHLFGWERTTPGSRALQGCLWPHCSYCGTHLPAGEQSHRSRALPWSLVGIDGLANRAGLVRCNGDKSGALPAIGIVDRVRPGPTGVEDIASAIQWPTQRPRSAAARGIYRGQPADVPDVVWVPHTVRLDINFPPSWLSTG